MENGVYSMKRVKVKINIIKMCANFQIQGIFFKKNKIFGLFLELLAIFCLFLWFLTCFWQFFGILSHFLVLGGYII